MKSPQAGAALAISMILLSILTLLAISTMNTAATELLMSGNDQYQVRAAQAAQTGIEQLIASPTFDPSSTQTLNATLPDGDSFTATLRPRGTTPAPAGYNNTFTAEHYEIESTGRSHRSAKSKQIQGFFVVRPMIGAPPPAADPSIPPTCLSGIEIRPRICKEVGAAVRIYWRPA